jgi:Fe-S oxidoreductase
LLFRQWMFFLFQVDIIQGVDWICCYGIYLHFGVIITLDSKRTKRMLINMNKWIDQIKQCIDCDICLEVCPTYETTRDFLLSPKGRLKAAENILENNDITEKDIKASYTCPKCAACETVCPEKIEVSKIVAEARNRIVESGKGPLPPHKKVIEGLLERGNAVNGEPGKRLAWLPEPFEPRESTTLLFVGCTPAYLVKDAARYSYLALKKLGIDFMVLEDEGCCGTYIYESGELALAGEYFRKNVERFKKLGITKLILPCNGCFKCFKYFYPEVLGSFDFEVLHVIQAIYNKVKDNPALLKKIDRKITYHDSCRLGRVEGYTEEPRQLLKWCGAEIYELPRSRIETLCCGSGGGIRSAFKELSFDIAKNLLNQTETKELITPCPFCTFNLGYTNKQSGMEKQITYITKIIWESLQDSSES